MKTNENTRKKVESLICLTSACPIQYSGSLESGESIYMRARSGILEVRIEGECIYLRGFDEFSDNIVQRLKHLFDFRECDCFNKKQKHKRSKIKHIKNIRLKSGEQTQTIDLRASYRKTQYSA